MWLLWAILHIYGLESAFCCGHLHSSLLLFVLDLWVRLDQHNVNDWMSSLEASLSFWQCSSWIVNKARLSGNATMVVSSGVNQLQMDMITAHRCHQVFALLDFTVCTLPLSFLFWSTLDFKYMREWRTEYSMSYLLIMFNVATLCVGDSWRE